MPYMYGEFRQKESEIDVFSLLQQTALFLWKDWPRDMQLTQFGREGFALRGTCPHCTALAAFASVTTYEDRSGEPHLRVIGIAQCIACSEYILAILKLDPSVGIHGKWGYELHYPLGKPDDTVSEDIPENIRLDFQEALRCQFIEGYNATAEMCRRAVEASCINLGAPYSKVLNDMIDWLESNRKITPTLKNVAHKIRLGGDRAAHPGEDPSNGSPKYETPIKIEKEHAKAIVEFTRHFLDSVYVMPSRLPKFDFSKPKKLPTT
jgi:hypothetical protein